MIISPSRSPNNYIEIEYCLVATMDTYFSHLFDHKYYLFEQWYDQN